MRLKTAYMAALVALALLTGGPALRAQKKEKADDKKKQEQTQQVQNQNARKDRSVKMNQSVQSYKLLGRYRPKNQPFHKGGFFANTYVTAMGAAYRQFANNYSNGPYASLTFGKWLTPFHGLELTAGACSFKDNYDGVRMYIVEPRLSYLFNISAYAGGYNPESLVELYAKAGLGYGLYLRENFPKTGSPSAHIGVQLNIHVLPGFDLVLEPLLEAQLDARKLPRMDVWRSYLLALQGGVGLKYNLDPMRRGSDPGLNWFVTATGGVQFQNSDFSYDIGFKRALGPSAVVGAGRYYTPAFALRLQVGSSTHFWKEIPEGAVDVYGVPLHTGRFRSTYFFARFEGKLDLFRIAPDTMLDLWAKYRQVGISVLAGPEVGYMIKKDPNLHDVTYPYVGLSAGLQVSVRLFAGLYLNLEPHVGIIPYSATSFTWANQNQDYYDALFGVSMGFEYRFGRYYL